MMRGVRPGNVERLECKARAQRLGLGLGMRGTEGEPLSATMTLRVLCQCDVSRHRPGPVHGLRGTL